MTRILPLAVILLFVTTIHSGIIKRGDDSKPADISHQATNRTSVDERGNKKYLVGDMEMDQEEENDLNSNGNGRTKRAAFYNKIGRKWPKPNYYVRIPYVIITSDFTSSQNKAINDMLDFIYATTCINWVNKTSSDTDYVEISDCGGNDGCWADLGKQGGKQKVCLGAGCKWPGMLAHEFGHAMNLIHEHQRSDRDSYVTINTNQIDSGLTGEFTKQATDVLNSANYEPGSIMHYKSTAFNKSPPDLDTITAKSGTDGSLFEKAVWERNFIYSDIKWLGEKYGCTWEPTTTVFNQKMCDHGYGNC